MTKSARTLLRLLALGLGLVIALGAHGAQAQRIGIDVQVTGPGSQGAYVDIVPLSGQPAGKYELAPRMMELEADGKGAVKVDGGRGIAGEPTPLQPGIYEVWVESGRKDEGGNYTGGTGFVYVGKDGRTKATFDLGGRPPVALSGERVFDIGQRAKAACNLVTWERAVNQLNAYAADIDKAMAELQSAIDAYVRDGLAETVPEPQRSRLGGIILAGGSPKGMVADLTNLNNEMLDKTTMRGPLSHLSRAYQRLADLAEEKAHYLDLAKRLQPPPDCPKRTAMYQQTLTPIPVGSKGTVGCDAKLKEDVAKTLGGFGGGGGLGALGGGNRSFGLGGGGGSSSRSPSRSSSSSEPKISPDPVPTDMKSVYIGDYASALSFGTRFTDKNLWVSAGIEKAPCQGTFQTAYLQDPLTGQKAGPTDYLLTGLYLDWKLTVSWTYDRWVNSEHVEHREGGWQDSGREILGTWTVPKDGKGVWNDLGWNTAVAGAKSMAFGFPITYADFAKKPYDIVVHVTNPDVDPVKTIPFAFETMAVGRDAGELGRSGFASTKAPSQRTPYEMMWKTPFPAPPPL